VNVTQVLNPRLFARRHHLCECLFASRWTLRCPCGSPSIVRARCHRDILDPHAPALAASSAAFAASLAAIMKDIYIADLAAFRRRQALRRFLSGFGQTAAHHQDQQALPEPDPGRQDRQLEAACGARDPRIARGLDKGDIVKAAAAPPASTTACR